MEGLKNKENTVDGVDKNNQNLKQNKEKQSEEHDLDYESHNDTQTLDDVNRGIYMRLIYL